MPEVLGTISEVPEQRRVLGKGWSYWNTDGTGEGGGGGTAHAENSIWQSREEVSDGNNSRTIQGCSTSNELVKSLPERQMDDEQ